MRPAPRALPDDLTGRLCELRARRRQLLVMSNAGQQPRLAKAEDRIAQRSFRTVFTSVIAERDPIDRAIDQLLGTGPLRRDKEDLLKSMPGIREIVARTLIAELPALCQVDRHPTAALDGVAPINRDSGRFRGQCRIPGARIEVCALLYVACLLAILHNPPLSARYRRLRGTAKPAKLALIAVRRQLITILNSMLRDRRVRGHSLIAAAQCSRRQTQ